MHKTVLTLSLMLAAYGLSLIAQTPSTTAAQEVRADLNQLMRGVLYPAANVVFFAQADNPGDAMALAESANLLSIPGRSCSNGAPVPTKDPAWAMFVQELRDVSMKAYGAAHAKDHDMLIEISETRSAAWAGCHR